jgi:hypothetical protein
VFNVTGICSHASVQVTLDAYADVIDSLMLQNVHDLKKKLSTEKPQEESPSESNVDDSNL